MAEPSHPVHPPAPAQPIDELALSEIKSAILAKLRLAIGKDAGMATRRDWYKAAALALRDRIVHRWLAADKQSYDAGRKRVYYLSLEFLIGRLFTDALNNMGLLTVFEAALGDLGVDLSDLRKCEPDAALGNGGLGRLAACFMESMATLGIPAIGYGIRYDFGLFRQIINNGWQQEYPDEWLSFGNPWEFQRPEVVYHIHFGGGVEHVDDKGRDRAIWHPAETVQAVAYDTPIVGWRGQNVNALRLWSARSPDPLRLDVFNTGDYIGAVAEEARAESICKFLYPNDESPAGRELRLRQEYFFVSASLQDLVKRHMEADGQLRSLSQKVAVQLNDTHPSLAVTELMRILVDLHNFRWDEAWKITVATFSYTNHTLLPEALETWPVELFERLLPRNLEIIYRINVGHLALAEERCPGDIDFRASVSLIDEKSGRRVRMGQLAFVGSHRINGVSAMHSDLMKETVFHDLNHLYPGRITNKTNGITFRRWLMLANPKLTGLLREACGEAVLDDPSRLQLLEKSAGDAAFQDQFRNVKHHNKIALARLIGEKINIKVDPTALFDVQIKRIHEYKRQLLNIVEAIALYHAIKDDPQGNWVPRVKIFAGKAAASYRYAKLIIKLINDVAEVVNNDPVIAGRLKIAFLPDYNVSLAEVIIPAADLSEQISTAGMEASGTGNMKLALNGAITIGTLDGANIEIRDHVGAENIAIFGMEAGDVMIRRKQGLDASDVIRASPSLARAINAIGGGEFSPDDLHRFESIAHALRHLDHYMVSADFDSYYAAQRGIDARWQAQAAWTRASILNVARMAWFSSDRTIAEYAEDIWNVPVNGRGQLEKLRAEG
ncbi:glycogen/starch/alpha-glucan phosphorylase [Bradyrhizobium sp.]|uniref:glycogen/starch/alpha-glucan phosphorylase n=1 Tax=Bradyrhizobium sp. TaxID=376 RepID=UPI002D2EED32|nr:glycogen/starch/alpha-glucan phosphorylase [Bradyrhizobium sp.]HZR71349.1 glycogen/starch/alpha-glucan phosphorylase [Bradyrhizobium sp.]